MPDWKYVLRKKNVELIDDKVIWLQCKKCGQLWSPTLSGGRLQRGYWHCPKGCNTK